MGDAEASHRRTAAAAPRLRGRALCRPHRSRRGGVDLLQGRLRTGRDRPARHHHQAPQPVFLADIPGFIAVTAAVLRAVTTIATSAQAAQALRAIAGNFAFALFAASIIGTGPLSPETGKRNRVLRRHRGLNRHRALAQLHRRERDQGPLLDRDPERCSGGAPHGADAHDRFQQEDYGRTRAAA